MNINFFGGNQYCDVSSYGELVEEDKQFYWQSRRVFNHIAPTIDCRIAKLEKLKPELRVHAFSDEDGDVQAAKLATGVLKYVQERIGLGETVSKATIWSETCGSAFYKIVWEADGGRQVAVDIDNKPVYEGEVRVTPVSPFEIFPDRLNAEDLDAVGSLIHAQAVSVDYVKERFGVDVVGKDVRRLVRVRANGGIGAGSETGALPTASASDYVQFTSTLKNLYGTIEISDKAIRASVNNEGAFVNLLNDEMETLIKSATASFGRMLYGDGTGKLATIEKIEGEDSLRVSNIHAVMPGMIVDFYDANWERLDDYCGVKILSVDNYRRIIKVDKGGITADKVPVGSGIYMQNSFGCEISGLDAIFSESETLYGVDRNKYSLTPYSVNVLEDLTPRYLETVIDTMEQNTGERVNFILCSAGVKRALTDAMRTAGMEVKTMDVNGAVAIDFYGIPVVSDRFCATGTMYLLNTNDFKLHQLCDWQWLEGEDGKILKQIPGKPVYTATLVKYVELMCERPCAQAKLTNITEA